MADEQTPPKRDVNELFTLDASEPPSAPDGPLAHLLSMSPVADLARQSVDTADVDPGPPGLADVSGLEDLFVTTADVPFGDSRAEPLPPATISSWAADVGGNTPVDLRPVDQPTIEQPTVDHLLIDEPTVENPTVEQSTGEVTVDHPLRPRPDEPIPVRLDAGVESDRFRSFEVGGNLRFSTEAGYRSGEDWSATGDDQPYPAALFPYAVPAPVSPGRSVRVPGQERRRGLLPTALIEITERRWFWASTVGVLGLVLLVLLAVGDFVPNPLARDRTVVAEERLPTAPAVGGATETSNGDTSSSTGAGSGTLQPIDPTTSSESTTTSTPTTAARRIITTARPAVRSTTATSTPTSASSSTSSTVSSTATTATTVSTTSTSTSVSSSSTTGSSTSTTTDPTTDTTESSSTTEGDPSTTSTTQASGATDP